MSKTFDELKEQIDRLEPLREQIAARLKTSEARAASLALESVMLKQHLNAARLELERLEPKRLSDN